jgi:DNA (cytosine-5)-methyltransferase 1
MTMSDSLPQRGGSAMPFSPGKPFSLISLFSGVGGMDRGFEKAGFNILWANDRDQTVMPSYTSFFPYTVFDSRSLRDISGTEIPKAGGVIGGPPCQSWSAGGTRRGIQDPQGQLFEDYLRVLHHVQPLFFVAENVPGLIQGNNRAFFHQMLQRMEQEGYLVTWKVVNAHDYGVPQDRRRVFIVGYHHSLNKGFVFPPPLSCRPTLRNAIFDLRRLKIGASRKVANHDLFVSGYSPRFMSRNRVRPWHKPSFTILASARFIPLHPQSPVMVSGKEGKTKQFAPGHEHLYRRLTVRECARIQTFPDDCHFIYTHVRHGYRMVGNAVPVELAFHLARAIRTDLEQYQHTEQKEAVCQTQHPFTTEARPDVLPERFENSGIISTNTSSQTTQREDA